MTTVMLVDDSATMLMSLKAILTKAGYAVETAGHGKEAWNGRTSPRSWRPSRT
ncbi:hypothetical protein AB0G04_16110 [Actinoplanes sp. NPDC023801]|uniref:hypothetical protein n=1 Tax=Actinoplanes sp. NPDC023801 TaxID=3154595 RepID=UPI0033CDD445